jgi:uncharacterized protein
VFCFGEFFAMTGWDQPLVKFGALLALGLMLSAWMLSGAITDRNRDDSIDVTGSASKEIVSDKAIWTVRFERQGKTAADAYKSIQADLNTVKTYLSKNGIADEVMSVGGVNTSTLYVKNSQGYETSQVEGYRSSQSITIESADPNKIAALSNQITELVTQGITLTSDSPQYYYSKLDDLKVDMLKEATKNALERGKGIAGSTGRDVGVLRSASAGVFQITAPTSQEVSDYGIYDTSSIKKKVTSVVNVTFSVR